MGDKKKPNKPRTSPPANTKWVPITQWKIAHLQPAPAPISRISKTLQMMIDQKQEQGQHQPRQMLLPIGAPKSKFPYLSPKTLDKSPGLTHSPSVLRLENLQNWFRQFFNKLSPEHQRLLMDYLLIYNLDIWAFEGGQDHFFLEAREFIEPSEKSKKNARLDAMMTRLSKLLTQMHNSIAPIDEDIEDRVFSNEADAFWSNEHILLQTLLESIVLELSGDSAQNER